MLLIVLFPFLLIYAQQVPPAQLIKKLVDKAVIRDHTIAELMICHRLDTMLGLSTEDNKTALSHILGRSHDPLTNVAKHHILTQSYSGCQKTPDFRFYVPNNYIVEMIMDRNFQKTMKETEQFSATTISGEANGGVSGGTTNDGTNVNGAANAGVKASKTKIDKEQTSMFSISLGNKMYRLASDLKPEFTPAFHNRIVPVINAIKEKSYDRARQLIERIILDYGTHVTTEAVVGTHIQRRIFIKKSITESKSSFSAEARAEARATLEKGAGGGKGGMSTNNTGDESEAKSSMDVTVYLQGGSEFKKIDATDINDLVDDSRPVALSRNVRPIYLFMSSGSLNCSNFESRVLRQLFEDATNEYFERNIYRGCMNNKRPNFDFQANVDDNTCMPENCAYEELKCGQVKNASEMTYYQFLDCIANDDILYTGEGFKIRNCTIFNNFQKGEGIGGMYQTCEPLSVTLKHHDELKKMNIDVRDPCENLITGNIEQSFDTVCPNNAKPVIIHNYVFTRPTLKLFYPKQFCVGTAETEQCFDVSTIISLRDKVNLTSYWCGPTNEMEFKFVYFAGYYDKGQINNFNLRRDCPKYAYRVSLFHGTTFCIYTTPQYEAYKNAQLTRLYSSDDPGAHCLSGHSRQLITVVDGTKIYACILKNQAYYDLPTPALIKGPFMNYETIQGNPFFTGFIEISINGMKTNSSYFVSIGHAIKTYYDDVLRQLKYYKAKEIELSKKSDTLSEFFSTKLVFIIVVAVCLFFCVFIIVQYRLKNQTSAKKDS